MKPVVAVGQPASTKSYFALNGSGAAALVGLEPTLTLSGKLNIAINSAKDTALPDPASAPVVDFKASAALNPTAYGSADGLKIITGTDPSRIS